MSIKISHATSVSNSAFRVVCGEMMLDSSIVSHHEALFGTLKSGTAVVQVADSTYTLRKGDVYFVAPNVKYSFSDYGDASIEVVTLNFANPAAVTQDYMPPSIIRALINGNCTPFAIVQPESEIYPKMVERIRDIKYAETEKFEYFQLKVYSDMYDVFFMLFSQKYVKIIDVENKSKKYRALVRVTNYIDEHYTEGISLDEVAGQTGISRYYVSHLFKELMNTTFVGYVNELRLNRAAMLLVTTDRPIIEIASISGFNNLSNFNRAFKMHFGKTPSAYRKA